jgi:GxxExxY protein
MEKDPLTYRIIGCAMKVHRTLGPGFQEVIYQRCLAIEFRRAGLTYDQSLRCYLEATIFFNPLKYSTRSTSSC